MMIYFYLDTNHLKWFDVVFAVHLCRRMMNVYYCEDSCLHTIVPYERENVENWVHSHHKQVYTKRRAHLTIQIDRVNFGQFWII